MMLIKFRKINGTFLKTSKCSIIDLLSTKENDKSPCPPIDKKDRRAAADGTESWRFVISKEKVNNLQKFNNLLLICVITVLFSTSSLYADQNPPTIETRETDNLQISGYYKNLVNSSKSSDTKENIFSDLQRLRLELKKLFNPWQFYLTLDNEAVVNDFANTSDFTIVRSKIQNQLASWDLDKVSVDNDHLYLKHSIYRAYVKYYSPQFQAMVGKQAIDWGRMHFYSPLDVFNPPTAIDLEPEERVGIDAINLNFSPESLAGINAVAAPGKNDEKTSLGLKLYKTINTYDCALIAARIKKATILGLSFDGYIQDAGFRGEITHTEDDNKRSFARVSAGLDYNFSDKLYFLGEQFFNGGHEDNDINAFTSSYQLSAQTLSIKKNLTSFLWKYSLTPLVDLSLTTIYDWDGKSVMANPQLKYNILSDIDLIVGSQFFWGNTNSEFGSYQHRMYCELKWFF